MKLEQIIEYTQPLFELAIQSPIAISMGISIMLGEGWRSYKRYSNGNGEVRRKGDRKLEYKACFYSVALFPLIFSVTSMIFAGVENIKEYAFLLAMLLLFPIHLFSIKIIVIASKVILRSKK